MTYSERKALVEKAEDEIRNVIAKAGLDFDTYINDNILHVTIDAVGSLGKYENILEYNESDDLEQDIKLMLEDVKDDVENRLAELEDLNYDPTYSWRQDQADAAGVPLFGPL